MSNKLISIIIPVSNDQIFLSETLSSLNSNNEYIYETIIIDSSTDKNSKIVSKILDDFNNKNLNIVYKKINPAFPGAARNLGLMIAKSDYIGFLDCKTSAKHFWLSDAIDEFNKNQGLMIVGSKIDILADTFFQKLLRASSYGNIPTTVMVGSVFKKEIINFIGYQREDVRSGEDIDWSIRVKNLNLKIKYPEKSAIKYRGLEKNLFKAVKKYFIYGLLSAKVDILRLYRALYFYTISFFGLFFIFNWNNMFAGWDLSDPFYIPNITKIFLLMCLTIYVIIRGIIRPLRRKEKVSFLLPINWLLISLLSFILDFFKAPGYLLGYILNFNKAKK